MAGSSQGHEVERRRVIFHGRVQGVGFRATTAGIARRYPVSGYVRNLADGTVELVAEAETRVLEEFIAAIEEAFRGSISRAEVSGVDGGEELEGFAVRR